MQIYCSWQIQQCHFGLQERGKTNTTPGPPSWGLGVGLATLSHKKAACCTEMEMRAFAAIGEGSKIKY